MAAADETVIVVRERAPLWARIAKWLGIALGVLVLLVALLALFINTGPGKRFIGTQLAGYTTASGINVRVGGIEGSIYGRFTLHDLQVRDAKGVFLTAPSVAIDWNPFAYVHSHIDLHSVTAPEIDMLRNPALKPVPSDPNAPILPDIDLTLGRLTVDRFILEAPVTGKRSILRLGGGATIADKRAQLALDGGTVAAPGVAGGDSVHLRLDAVPEQNRLLIGMKLAAPAGGLVDSYAHLGRPLALSIGGKGDWTAWNGTVQGTLGGQPLADLGLQARNGTFRLLGNVKPGIMLSGPAARMTEPQIDVDATATLAERRADTVLKLRSSAFALDAAGLLDFAHSRFGNLRVNAQLLTPGAILPNLAGRDVKAALVLDGAFAKPTMDYQDRCRRAGVRHHRRSSGSPHRARRRSIPNKILVPIHATALRVTGRQRRSRRARYPSRDRRNDCLCQRGQVFSDDLHLRSDNIDATALVLADLRHRHLYRRAQGPDQRLRYRRAGADQSASPMRTSSPRRAAGSASRAMSAIVTTKTDQRQPRAAARRQCGRHRGRRLRSEAAARASPICRLTAPDFRITQRFRAATDLSERRDPLRCGGRERRPTARSRWSRPARSPIRTWCSGRHRTPMSGSGSATSSRPSTAPTAGYQVNAHRQFGLWRVQMPTSSSAPARVR